MPGTMMGRAVTLWLALAGHAMAGLVNLTPDKNGDRVAVATDGKVAYLPAKRVNVGATNVGGGYCRYIKRTQNGDLYVMGPNLGNRLFRSTDGGHHWTSSPWNIEQMAFLSAFAILADDTFVVAYMPSPLSAHKAMWVARSSDRGKTWDANRIQLDLDPFTRVMGWNADIVQIADGTLLLTLDMRASVDAVHDETGAMLPPHLKGGFLYIVRSRDGAKTWGDRSRIPASGGEVHLCRLPSGKLMAAVRKQRWHRAPGDPASVLEIKKRYGYKPLMGGGVIEDSEEANRIKNIFVSESYDDGYTWVNEQQVSDFMQCSGDLTYTTDGVLVLQYLHRYHGGPIANVSIRARVSYNNGNTWEPEEYVLSDGENYPSGIAGEEGSVITMCPHRGQIQAVHWRPLPRDKPPLAYRGATQRGNTVSTAKPLVRQSHIAVSQSGGETLQLPVTRVNLLPPAGGAKHSPIHYTRNSAAMDRAGDGTLYCAGNVLGQRILRSSDQGTTWKVAQLGIPGWGSMVGFKILRDDTFVVLFEPVGNPHRILYVARSTDRGETWQLQKTRLDIAPYTQLSGKGHNLLELNDGTLLVTLRLWGATGAAADEQQRGPVDAPTHVLRSVDGGKTWTGRSPLAGLAGQTRLRRLASGKLLACVFNLKIGVTNKLMLAESDDGGQTWINPREVSAARQPGGANLTQLADGTVVLEYLYDTAPGKSPHSNWYYVNGLRSVISRDEGKTWQPDVYVVSRQTAPNVEPTGGGAYLSDSVALDDGRLFTACVHFENGGMQFQGVTWKPLPVK